MKVLKILSWPVVKMVSLSVQLAVQLIISLLILSALGWFGITCMKLGWYANDHPFWNPILATVLKLNNTTDNEPQEASLLDKAMQLLPNTNNAGGKDK